MHSNQTEYKIVIIGAGPAGSCCALALAQSGFRDVVLIESGEYNKFHIGETIPPESKILFLQLGIYKEFLDEHHDPCYGSCSYWGDDRRGYNDSLLNPHGHGWHLDRRRFNYFLSKQAEAAGVKLLTATEYINAVETDPGGFELQLRDKSGNSFNLPADFVIDATGSRSAFAKDRGSIKLSNEPLVCLAARYKIIPGQNKLSGQTHLEAVEYGWWYAARLPGEIMLVALYTDSDVIKSMGLNKPDKFHGLLSETINTSKLVTGSELIDNKTKAFPAPSFVLDKICGSNWMAIGDAASAFDPVTSQGIMKSMSDAIQSAEILRDYLSGNPAGLIEFESMMKERYYNYLNIRRYYYNLEVRWPESYFWQKFQGKLSKAAV